jgi:hypothetical protein
MTAFSSALAAAFASLAMADDRAAAPAGAVPKHKKCKRHRKKRCRKHRR